MTRRKHRRRPGALTSLPELVLDGIDEVDLMALGSQPGRVDAGGTAHVENPTGLPWQVSGDDLLGPGQLDATLRARQPISFGEHVRHVRRLRGPVILRAPRREAGSTLERSSVQPMVKSWGRH